MEDKIKGEEEIKVTINKVRNEEIMNRRIVVIWKKERRNLS
jgi:hypothetical protein